MSETKTNSFEKYFRESLEKAAESCSIALSDILTERRRDKGTVPCPHS